MHVLASMSYLVPLGLIFILMVIFMPQGLLGFARRWLNRIVRYAAPACCSALFASGHPPGGNRGLAHQGREASYVAARCSRASPVAYALRRRCISRIESSATRRSAAVRMYLRMAPSVSPASSRSTSSCTT